MAYPLTFASKISFFYNCVSFTLWFCCLGRLAMLLPLVGRKFVAGGMADFFHIVSVLPVLGLVLNEAPFNTTRPPTSNSLVPRLWNIAYAVKMVWMCYAVIYPYPKIAKHTAYSTLILGWSVANFIESSYDAFKVKTRTSPHFLFWTKYHHFYVTLPISLVSEFVLIFLSLLFVEDGFWYEYALKFMLCAYIPLGYIYWGHLANEQETHYSKYMVKKRQGTQAGNTK